MTFSAFVHDKTGRRIVRVSFERMDASGRSDLAEGIVPGATIEKNQGFSAEEVAQLTDYLRNHESDILKRAGEISDPMRWMS